MYQRVMRSPFNRSENRQVMKCSEPIRASSKPLTVVFAGYTPRCCTVVAPTNRNIFRSWVLRSVVPATVHILEHFAMSLVHVSSWGDGRLFGRSQKEDSRGRAGAPHEPERSCSCFRG